MNSASFPSHYRLKSRKRISELHSSGTKYFKHPFLLYSQENNDKHPRYAFSVPKKNFRKAVDRNRIKRLMREMVRLKHSEFDIKNKTLFHRDFLLIYIGKEEMQLKHILPKWEEILQNISK